ncbi:MAG: ATP-binding protein [Verrucomicrobia bacterium]|nr:ATP-binding protein [Verrucomicrobiota bacterium]
MNSDTVIPPETLALKLAAADSLQNQRLADQLAENPRLVEALWFVQWKSLQPGGLRAFSEELLTAFPDQFVTKTMLALGRPRRDRYTPEQCWAVWGDFYERFHARWHEDEVWTDNRGPVSEMDLTKFLAYYYDAGKLAKLPHTEEIRQGVERFNWEFLKAHCRPSVFGLSELLAKLCDQDNGHYEIFNPWYCPELLNLLVTFMDQHAAREQARLAKTEVAERVFDALDYAWAEKRFVRINGNSRFGKTESVRVRAAMYPGRLRLVTVPCSNSLRDLVRAVAESLGISVSYGADGPALNDKVEFILKHGRLGFIFDEAHFLFPTRYNRDTVPARLNWLRTRIVDLPLPCVLLATPQAYDGQSHRFEKATRYNMDQFLGREDLVCDLPETLESTDLEAVARIHFPTLRDAPLKLVIGAALVSESYLKAVESLASRSRWLAAKRGAKSIALDDVQAAIRDVVPAVAQMMSGRPSATTPQLDKPAAVSLPRRRMTAATAMQAHCPGRSTAISQPEPPPRNATLTVPVSASLVPA